jgi:hypothetical protein
VTGHDYHGNLPGAAGEGANRVQPGTIRQVEVGQNQVNQLLLQQAKSAAEALNVNQLEVRRAYAFQHRFEQEDILGIIFQQEQTNLRVVIHGRAHCG